MKYELKDLRNKIDTITRRLEFYKSFPSNDMLYHLRSDNNEMLECHAMLNEFYENFKHGNNEYIGARTAIINYYELVGDIHSIYFQEG